MKSSYNDHPVLFIGLFISLASGAVSLALNASPADAFIITVATSSLTLLVEVLLNTRPLTQFKLFTRSQMHLLLENDRIAANVIATLDSYTTAKSITDNPVFQKRFERVIAEQTQQLKNYASGRFTSSLRPDFFFREPDVLEMFTERLVATSMVDPRDYWSTEWARHYLEDQASAQERIRARLGPNYVAIERIFIEERRRLLGLIPALQLHQDLGIRASVAILEDVPDELRKDFMVIDGKLLLWLSFSPGTRTPVASTVVVRKTAMEHEIDQHVDLFDKLKAYARDPLTIPSLANRIRTDSAAATP